MPRAPNFKHEKEKEGKKTETVSGTEKLTFLLKKFNIQEILDYVLETPSDRPKKFMKKRTLIKDAINILVEKFSDLDELILFLQLRYFRTQKKARYWNVLEINDGKRFKQPDLSSETILQRMQKYFNKYGFSCKIYCEKLGDCIWTALSFDDDDAKNSACLVTQMKVPLVLYHSLKQKYLVVVKKVLIKTYKGTDIEEFPPIYNNIEFVQKLNANTWNSVGLNSNNAEKFKTPVDCIKIQIQGVKEKSKKPNNPQSKLLTQNATKRKKTEITITGTNETEVPPNDLQSNLVFLNERKKKKTTTETQDEFVNEKEKEVSASDLQSNVTYNVKKNNKVSNESQSKFASDDLQNYSATQYSKKNKAAKKQRNFDVENRRQEEQFVDWGNNLVTSKTKEKSKAANEPDIIFVENVLEEPLDDFQSNIEINSATNKSKIANEPQTNFVDEDIEEDSSDDVLQKNVNLKSVKKRYKNLDEAEINFVSDNLREESADNVQSNFATADIKKRKELQNNCIARNVNKKSKTVKEPQINLIGDNVIENIFDYGNSISTYRTKEKIHDESELPSNSGITDTTPNLCDNAGIIKRKDKLTGETLEKPDLPPIKKLTFFMKSNSFGLKENASSVCAVKFEGTDILKGMQMLVDRGMAGSSLPDYLCKVPQTGKSEYVINL